MGLMFGIVMMVVALVFEVSIGITVYKDAKALGLNAILWTVVAVLVPNFVGIIIYLVVRSNTPKKAVCSNCKAQVKNEYNICPECGGRFVVFCKRCNKPIEPGLKICPYCGESTEDAQQPTSVKVYPKTNIAKPIGILAAVALGIVIIGLIGSFIFNNVAPTIAGNLPSNVSIMAVENNMGNKYTSRFHYKSGHSIVRFKTDGKSEAVLEGELEVKKGSISIEMKDSEGNVVFEQKFDVAQQPYQINCNLGTKKTKYTAHVRCEKAEGSIKLEVKEV